jgi:hypothetical protein
LLDAQDNEVQWSNMGISGITANSGNDSPSGEGPDNLVNNNTYDKWFSWAFGNPSWVQIAFNNPVDLSQYPKYRWYTANDSEGRDPVSWKILASKDGVSWFILDSQTNASITTSRNASAGTWNIKAK